VEALTRFGARALSQAFRGQDPSCIAWSRIGRDVLAQLGVQSTCVPARLRVCNAAARRHVDAKQPWMIGSGDGSWYVSIGGGGQSRPGRWDGHMVLLAEERFLVDLTLHQAARPEYGIHVEPAWFPLDAPLVHGEPVSFLKLDGTVMQYERDDTLPPYQDTPGWTRDYRSLVRLLVRRLRPVVNAE
jgi:hypothetical protein